MDTQRHPIREVQNIYHDGEYGIELWNVLLESGVSMIVTADECHTDDDGATYYILDTSDDD